MTSISKDALGVPIPPNPVETGFSLDGVWRIGEQSEHTIEGDNWSIDVEIDPSRGHLRVAITTYEGLKLSEAIWSTVHWCRAYKVSGVWKEELFVEPEGPIFRLGGLYRYAGFELSERESDYIKYGEHPFKEGQELGY